MRSPVRAVTPVSGERGKENRKDVGFAYGWDDASVFPLTTEEMGHRKTCEIFRGRVQSSPFTDIRENEVETVY